MKARVGDRIVIASNVFGGAVRDGEILETHGAKGSPPYLVRWTDNGHEALYFPGIDGRIESTTPDAETRRANDTSPGVEPARHVRTWIVTVDIFENGLDTSAHAVLRAEPPERLEADGTAHRHPADPDAPDIGDEIAVARALRHLADRLLATAADDVEILAGHPVGLNKT